MHGMCLHATPDCPVDVGRSPIVNSDHGDSFGFAQTARENRT